MTKPTKKTQTNQDPAPTPPQADILNAAGTPDAETPDAEAPDVETPDAGAPEAEMPDADTPDVENPEAETPDVETPDAETLLSIQELAMHFRVPSWQLASLLRNEGLEDDAQLTQDAFKKALEKLSNRKMGQ